MTASPPTGSPGHERWEELAVGHALNALEPSDEDALAGHLATCASCRSLAAEMTEVAADLAYAAEPSEPPPAIWQGITAAIAASDRPARHDSVPEARTGSAPEARPSSVPDARTASLPSPELRPTARPAWLRSTALAVAAALIGIAGLGGVVFAGRFLQVRSDKATAERQLSAVLDCAARTDCAVVPMRGQDGGSASAVALIAARASTVRLVVNNLAGTDRNSTYVLWASTPSGDMTGVAAFGVADGGRHIVASNLRIPILTRSGQTLAVTREPGRTIPVEPSTRPLLQGTAASAAGGAATGGGSA